MLNSDWARNPAQMWRIYLQSTCLKHCFPASFVPWPLLVSTNNHGFSYPCSRKCSVRRIFFFMAQQPLVGQGLLLIGASRSHSIRHTALGRNPLDKWSAQRRDLYLTTQNTYKRQTNSCPRQDWNPQPQPNKQLQTHSLDSAETGIGVRMLGIQN